MIYDGCVTIMNGIWPEDGLVPMKVLFPNLIDGLPTSSSKSVIAIVGQCNTGIMFIRGWTTLNFGCCKRPSKGVGIGFFCFIEISSMN